VEFLKELFEKNSESILVDLRVGRNTTLNDDCELGERLEFVGVSHHSNI
jgi:hypothetical protein